MSFFFPTDMYDVTRALALQLLSYKSILHDHQSLGADQSQYLRIIIII